MHNIPPLFYAWHWTSTFGKLVRLGLLLWRVDRIRRRVEAEHKVRPYTDVAITRLPRRAGADLAPDEPAVAAE